MAMAGRRFSALRPLTAVAVAAVIVTPLLAATGCASTQSQDSASSNAPSTSLSSAPASVSAPGSGSASASASSIAAAACRTSELKISLGPGGVAAGTWAALLELTNVGGAPCTVTGWSTIAGVTSSGAVSPATNRSGSMDGLDASGTPRLTLAPGGNAGIDISGTDNAAGGGSCPAPYEKLRVSAPGDSSTVTIPATTSTFSTGLPSCAPLSASPVHLLSDFSFPGLGQ